MWSGWSGMFCHLDQPKDERSKGGERKTKTGQKGVKRNHDRSRGGVSVFLRLASRLLQCPKRPDLDPPEIRLGQKSLRGIDRNFIGSDRHKRLWLDHTPDRNYDSGDQANHGSKKHCSEHRSCRACHHFQDRSDIAPDHDENCGLETGYLSSSDPEQLGPALLVFQ